MKKLIINTVRDKALWELVAIGTGWAVFFVILYFGFWLIAILNGVV